MAIDFVVGLTDKISGPASKAASSVADMIGKVTGLSEAFDSLEKAVPGIGAVANAVLGLGKAIVSTAFDMIKTGAQWAIEASDFKGDTIDALENILQSRDAAEQAWTRIDALSKKIPTSLERIAGLTTELESVGAKDTDRLITAIADVEAAMGPQRGAAAGKKLESLITKVASGGAFKLNANALKGTGLKYDDIVSELSKSLGKTPDIIKAQLKKGTIAAQDGLDAIAKVAEKKFGGMAGKQMLDLDVQTSKFKENVKSLFADVKTEGFLKGLSTVLKLFDTNTASGRALKFLLTGLFDGFFAAATKVFPYVKAAILGLVIAALKIYIAFKPAIKALGDLFKGPEDKGAINTIAKIAEVMGYLAVGALIVGAIITGVVLSPLLLLAGAIMAAGEAFDSAKETITSAWDKISEIVDDAESIAADFIQGMIDGITNGTSALVDAAKKMAKDVVGGVKSTLGISSPSRVMRQVGGYTAEGMVLGIDERRDEVANAMSGIVRPPENDTSGRGGGTTITLMAGAIQISVHGVQDADDFEARAPAIVADAFRQLAAMQGR